MGSRHNFGMVNIDSDNYIYAELWEYILPKLKYFME